MRSELKSRPQTPPLGERGQRWGVFRGMKKSPKGPMRHSVGVPTPARVLQFRLNPQSAVAFWGGWLASIYRGAVSCLLRNIARTQRNASVGLGLLAPRGSAKSFFRWQEPGSKRPNEPPRGMARRKSANRSARSEPLLESSCAPVLDEERHHANQAILNGWAV